MTLVIFVAGEIIPPFFDGYGMAHCVDREKCEWLKPNDVVVDVCGKCGTNWMMTVVHELRTWDQPHMKEFRDILDISPWIDLKQFPGVRFCFASFDIHYLFK